MNTRSKSSKEQIENSYLDSIKNPFAKKPKIPRDNEDNIITEGRHIESKRSDKILERNLVDNTICETRLNHNIAPIQTQSDNIIVDINITKTESDTIQPLIDKQLVLPTINRELTPSSSRLTSNTERMAVGNAHTVSLRDALEVVPYYDGSNIPFSTFSTGCKEAQDMLPADAEANLAKMIRTRLLGESRRVIEGRTFINVASLLDFLKKMFAHHKSLCQLQGELGNTYQKKNESVVSFATRTKELGNRILEAHKNNNNGVADQSFRILNERELLRCFVNGLHSEIEQRLKEENNVDDTIQQAIAIEQRLLSVSAMKRSNNTVEDLNFEKLKIDTENCQICFKKGHNASTCNNRFRNPDQNNEFNTGTNITICQICKRRGHDAVRCRLREIRRQENRPVRYVKEEIIQCQLCKDMGHSADKCYMTPKIRTVPTQSRVNCQLCHQNGHTADRCFKNQPIISCQICQKSGDTANRCWHNKNNNNANNNNNYQKPLICRNCGKTGHTTDRCFARNQTNNNTNSSPPQCRYCKKFGHLIENCMTRERANQQRIDQGNEAGPSGTGVQRETLQTTRPTTSHNTTR